MTDTQTRGMDIAPDVLDTIVALALKDVEGVAVVGQTSTGILSFFGSKQERFDHRAQWLLARQDRSRCAQGYR